MKHVLMIFDFSNRPPFIGARDPIFPPPARIPRPGAAG